MVDTKKKNAAGSKAKKPTEASKKAAEKRAQRADAAKAAEALKPKPKPVKLTSEQQEILSLVAQRDTINKKLDDAKRNAERFLDKLVAEERVRKEQEIQEFKARKVEVVQSKLDRDVSDLYSERDRLNAKIRLAEIKVQAQLIARDMMDGGSDRLRTLAEMPDFSPGKNGSGESEFDDVDFMKPAEKE